MTERHHGHMVLRGGKAAGASMGTGRHARYEWREARNGIPGAGLYVPRDADADRAAEVARMVAGARSEALRRARARLGPGPLERRTAGGWEPCGPDEPAVSA